jgi:pimeloyl-ACP methyl ester carboxylesterase
MERASVNGVELEYEVQGKGEPVILVHGGLLCDEMTPLVREPALTSQFRVINYHRRGFAGSTQTQGRAVIADQAKDCKALLDHLGVKRAHVCGHSSGGMIAIQVALDAPEHVHSLALLEPALMGAIAKAEAVQRPDAVANQQKFKEGIDKVQEIAATGDRRAALDYFLDSRAGEAFHAVHDWLRKTGEFEQALADFPTFMRTELPAAFAFTFGRPDAARLKVPLLSVLGSHSPERAQKVHGIMLQWMPQTETAVIPNAEHALPLLDPPGTAKVLAEFFSRHPMKAA